MSGETTSLKYVRPTCVRCANPADTWCGTCGEPICFDCDRTHGGNHQCDSVFGCLDEEGRARGVAQANHDRRTREHMERVNRRTDFRAGAE